MNSLILLPLCFAAAFAGAIPSYAPLAGYAAAPYAAVATPVAYGTYGVARSQHHSQDNYGNYDYGYVEPNSAKRETRHPDGTVTGSYSHALPNGRILTNNYVADEYGFRSSLAPTAAKDFSPVVKAAYNVQAPLLAQTVAQVAYPQPALHVTKSVQYAAAPATIVKSYAHHAPALVRQYGGPVVQTYGSPVVNAAYAASPYGYGYNTAPLLAGPAIY